MNYKRQSTVGWSIGNIFLDFTGGMLSMMQMIINAHNYGKCGGFTLINFPVFIKSKIKLRSKQSVN